MSISPAVVLRPIFSSPYDFATAWFSGTINQHMTACSCSDRVPRLVSFGPSAASGREALLPIWRQQQAFTMRRVLMIRARRSER